MYCSLESHALCTSKGNLLSQIFNVDPNGRINMQNWRFLSLILGVVVPRNKVILNYLHAHLRRCGLEAHNEEGKFAQYCLQTLQRTIDAKNRKYPPSRQEAFCVVHRFDCSVVIHAISHKLRLSLIEYNGLDSMYCRAELNSSHLPQFTWFILENITKETNAINILKC